MCLDFNLFIIWISIHLVLFHAYIVYLMSSLPPLCRLGDLLQHIQDATSVPAEHQIIFSAHSNIHLSYNSRISEGDFNIFMNRSGGFQVSYNSLSLILILLFSYPLSCIPYFPFSPYISSFLSSLSYRVMLFFFSFL